MSPDSGVSTSLVGGSVHSQVDVLIIGAGPAGSMMANWLSRFSSMGVTTRIIDRRPTELLQGQADGLMARTMEMFEHIGILPDIQRECCPVSELRFWGPDLKSGRLHRTSVMPQDVPGDSRFLASILHQSRIEHFLNEDTSRNSDGNLVVERGIFPEALTIDESAAEDPSAHPIKVLLRHLSYKTDCKGIFSDEAMTDIDRSTLLSAEEQDILQRQSVQLGRSEVVTAKYVIGCDGAHSWVRRQLGIAMVGEQTNFVWGVVEGIPITNFPDIRARAVIRSTNHGALMVIPQEREMVRLYIQLPFQVDPDTHLDRSKITSEGILENARAILTPYSIDMRSIEWYTGYSIGQRLTESFSKINRVFLAGDACHTHSPKAGQGMNVSMQDTYNLGWKMGQVLVGRAKPEILQTYSDERTMVAQDLINFDHKLSRLFSGQTPANRSGEDGGESGAPSDGLKRALEHANRYGAGMLIEYPDSAFVRKDLSRSELSKQLQVGKRFFSTQVINIASANPEQLVSKMHADGAFRVLVFAGRVAEPAAMERLRRLGVYLDGSESIISRYTPVDRPRDSVVDVLTIHSSPRLEVELYDFPQPSIFLPHHYDKLFCDGPSYHKGDGKAYDVYGIDKDEGAIVVVRPDNYVGLIVGLNDTEKLDLYFAGFLIPVAEPHTGDKIEVVLPPKEGRHQNPVNGR